MTAARSAVQPRQELVIKDWLPDALTNGPRGHWSVYQKKLKAAQTMVWAEAKHQGLKPITGRARVTITLVFGVERRRDRDGLFSRVKGLLDGLVKGGWLVDDSLAWLDLDVRAEVQKGVKETRITLEALD
jgi:hypothetical protein